MLESGVWLKRQRGSKNFNTSLAFRLGAIVAAPVRDLHCGDAELGLPVSSVEDPRSSRPFWNVGLAGRDSSRLDVSIANTRFSVESLLVACVTMICRQ